MRAAGWVLAVAAGSLALRLLLAGDGPVAAALAALAGLLAAVSGRRADAPKRTLGSLARSDDVIAERRFER